MASPPDNVAPACNATLESVPTTHDREDLLSKYKRVADDPLGDPRAKFCLAVSYLEGVLFNMDMRAVRRIEKDNVAARYLLLELANCTHPDIRRYSTRLLLQHDLVVLDVEDVYRWYRPDASRD